MRRCDESDAERQAVALEPGRDGGGDQVKQVHEVSVIAEVGIQPDGVGLDLRNSIGRPGGGGEQHVDVLPHRIAYPLQRTLLVEIDEGIRRADVTAAADDFAHRPEDLVRLRVKEITDRKIAPSNPVSPEHGLLLVMLGAF